MGHQEHGTVSVQVLAGRVNKYYLTNETMKGAKTVNVQRTTVCILGWSWLRSGEAHVPSQFKSVQFSRWVVSDSATPWTAALQASLSITNSWSLLKLIFIELVLPSNHLILCRPLLLLLSSFPSMRVFLNESILPIRWPKYWSFSCSITPYKEHPGLISFRMDWLDHIAVQGTLKSLLQHHSSINSLALSFLYSPTLTSIHDYWKNHSFD